MLVASSRFEVPLVFAGLIVTGVMGVAMYVDLPPASSGA